MTDGAGGKKEASELAEGWGMRVVVSSLAKRFHGPISFSDFCLLQTGGLCFGSHFVLR